MTEAPAALRFPCAVLLMIPSLGAGGLSRVRVRRQTLCVQDDD